jgi:hypothetical protein
MSPSQRLNSAIALTKMERVTAELLVDADVSQVGVILPFVTRHPADFRPALEKEMSNGNGLPVKPRNRLDGNVYDRWNSFFTRQENAAAALVKMDDRYGYLMRERSGPPAILYRLGDLDKLRAEEKRFLLFVLGAVVDGPLAGESWDSVDSRRNFISIAKGNIEQSLEREKDPVIKEIKNWLLDKWKSLPDGQL